MKTYSKKKNWGVSMNPEQADLLRGAGNIGGSPWAKGERKGW